MSVLKQLGFGKGKVKIILTPQERMLEDFENGRMMLTEEMIGRYGHRFSAKVFNLRREGHNIIKKSFRATIPGKKIKNWIYYIPEYVKTDNVI